MLFYFIAVCLHVLLEYSFSLNTYIIFLPIIITREMFKEFRFSSDWTDLSKTNGNMVHNMSTDLTQGRRVYKQLYHNHKHCRINEKSLWNPLFLNRYFRVVIFKYLMYVFCFDNVLVITLKIFFIFLFLYFTFLYYILR